MYSVQLTVEEKQSFKAVLTCPNLSELVSASQQYSDHVRPSRNVIFLHFPMLLFFGLTSYPAEIVYFNSPHGELSYGVRVTALYLSKIVNPSRSPCLKTVQRKISERSNFLVLHPVLLKIA